MLKEDLCFDEVLKPLNNYCSILQHTPPLTWKHPDGEQKMKFYKIKSKNKELNNKIACELCIIIANHLANNLKPQND